LLKLLSNYGDFIDRFCSCKVGASIRSLAWEINFGRGNLMAVVEGDIRLGVP